MTSRSRHRWSSKLVSLASTLTAQLPFEFNLLSNLQKSYPLMIVGAFETSLPFLRMLVLTRLLSLTEVGFVSVLTAFITFLEVSTDIAVHRFIYSANKEQFKDALASAHALALLRGILVSLIGLCIAPFVASALSLGEYWMSFALLAPPVLMRSLENLSPRVAERDFRYWPQLKTTGIASSVSLFVLVVSAYITRNHEAIIFSIYAYVSTIVIASHYFAEMPYRLNFRGDLFKAAFKFSYPLLVNGLGLSISMQGDRFVVAAFFDLQTVAVYSIVMLAAVVPLSLMGRILQTAILARFYHASTHLPRLSQEVKTASSLVAVLGALYGGAVVLLLNPVVMFVFGRKFYAGHLVMMLLGAVVLVRLVRLEPFTSVMLNAGRTKRLAASNIVTSSSLAYMIVVSFLNRSMSGLLAGRWAGEFTSLVVTFFMARKAPEVGRFCFTFSTVVGVLFFGLACVEAFAVKWAGDSFLLTLAAYVAYALAVSVWGAFDLRRRMSLLRFAALEERTLGKDEMQRDPAHDLAM